ncbi:MAG: HD domain-containing protein [Lachnospiraceae bacterium]|nr:HD domain-containing protein [Lachnospiraceae bacterium]
MFDFIRAHQLNIMLLLCGACGVLMFLLLITHFLRSKKRWILIFMEFVAMSLLWFDRLAYIYAGVPDTTGYIMVRISNFMVFFLTSGIAFGFNMYLRDFFINDLGYKKVPRRLKVTGTAAAFGMLLAVIAAFTDLYYYFDESNLYHRGKGFLIAYIIPVVCSAIEYTVIRQYKKNFSRIIYISLFLYLWVPVSCGILQIFTYGISIVNMSMVMVSISLYLFTYIDINREVEHAHDVEIRNMQGEHEKMKRLFDQTAKAFVSAVEIKDDFMKGNSERTAELARKIAEYSGKDEDECEKVYYAALLHDVGIIGVPDRVINNDTDPDESDREIIKNRTVIGKEILSNITEYPYLGEGAHYSHERYNGTGYPEGLKGEEIPEIARIIGVADAYVTMTSPKRYREAKPDFVAREAFVKGGGREFDPKYAEIMIKLLDKKSERGSDDVKKIEKDIICGKYREQTSAGIPVENEITRITFECRPAVGSDDGFSAPSLILFDAYDGRVHDNRRSIDAYKYVEYGEIWFDEHSIRTEAGNIKDTVILEKESSSGDSVSGLYEILAGRYEDHLKLKMNSPAYEKEVIIALPNGSQSAYISLTGENCEIKDISTEAAGKKTTEGDIPRIAEVKSYIDRIESDVKNVQIDRTRSASTEGIELKERLKINFHTMSLPGASLVWHCPYFVIFYSEDGKVGGPGYREYGLIKLYGENENNTKFAGNNISVRKTEEFPGWDTWKEINKAGLECEVTFRRKKDRVILRTCNMGVDMENITTITDGRDKIYVALTGDQVAITDIRLKGR